MLFYFIYLLWCTSVWSWVNRLVTGERFSLMWTVKSYVWSQLNGSVTGEWFGHRWTFGYWWIVWLWVNSLVINDWFGHEWNVMSKVNLFDRGWKVVMAERFGTNEGFGIWWNLSRMKGFVTSERFGLEGMVWYHMNGLVTSEQWSLLQRILPNYGHGYQLITII